MFEFEISRSALINPLLMVSGAVDKKQSVAVLSNILIHCTTNNITLTATDLEIEITALIPYQDMQSTGAVTVPAKKLVEIIRTLDESAVPVFAFKDKLLTIKEGRSLFKLTTLPAEEYPNAEDEPSEVEFTIERLALIQLLQSTHFAMSQQDVRIFLNGLLLELEDDRIKAVATDGHRMAIGRLNCKTGPQRRQMLMPRKGVIELLRLLNTLSDDQVVVSAGKNHFRLKASQYTFTSRLIDARFPPYARAIPKNNDKQVVLDRDILRRVLSRIVILAHERSRAIQLVLQPAQLTLIATNQAQEEAIESLEAETEGNDFKIGLNATYLLDVLNHIEPGPLRLSMSHADSSILIESLDGADYQYIIMPMKL